MWTLNVGQCITYSWVSIPINLWRIHLVFPSDESRRWSILFFQLMVKLTIRGKIIVINIYFLWGLWRLWLWFILVIILCHCWHQEIWRQVQFSFPSRRWYFWMNFKLLCSVYFWIYSFKCFCLSKSWWDNLCLLVVLYMLWMNM